MRSARLSYDPLPARHQHVHSLAARIAAMDEKQLYTSEIVRAELRYGLARLRADPQARHRQRVEKLLDTLAGRVLPVSPALEIFPVHKAHLSRIGRLVSDFDLLIACTALAHDPTLVTRNVKDFVNLSGLRLENWVDQ